MRSEIGFALEDAPAGLVEERFIAVLGHLAALGGAHVVEGFIHLGDDVKTVEDVECLQAFVANHAEIGLHMSEQTNWIWELSSVPSMAKNPWEVSTVRSWLSRSRFGGPR